MGLCVDCGENANGSRRCRECKAKERFRAKHADANPGSGLDVQHEGPAVGRGRRSGTTIHWGVIGDVAKRPRLSRKGR